jgi:hypothetical protein
LLRRSECPACAASNQAARDEYGKNNNRKVAQQPFPEFNATQSKHEQANERNKTG